jgi:ribosomal protein S6--L-glutamate ligase
MKIAILSRNAKLYSTQRLVEEARTRGHTVRVLDPLRCYMKIEPGDFQLRYKGKAIGGFDAVIPRIGASISFYGTAVLRQFELMGSYTPNSSEAIARARDKLRCHQLLAAAGIGLPSTVIADNPDDTGDVMHLLGPTPHIIKLNEGSQGSGVILAENASSSRSVIDTLRGLYANFLMQEFIAESKGMDIRCFVVGNEVVAAMQRQAEGGDFRSNLHRGGKASAVKLSAHERETAIQSAQLIGLRVAGVDLLRSKRGPLVLEVNASPGLEGIEAATGKNVAGAILKDIEIAQSAARPSKKTKTRSSKIKH